MEITNPLYRFRYCPLCGADGFAQHAENARRCPQCGFTYYVNPRGATVAVILNDQEEILVATRANEPARGTLDMPGGFMDLGETVEEAMCREIKEETGLQVKSDDLHYLFSQSNLYDYSGITLHTADMFFEVRVCGRPESKAQDDVAQLQWKKLSELRLEDFGFTSIRQGLKRILTERGYKL